jgi:hypothetical protein
MAARRARGRVLTLKTPGRSSAILNGKDRHPRDRTMRDAAGEDHQADSASGLDPRAVPDVTTTVLTMTLTGLAADSWLAGGRSPRAGRRVAAVGLMAVGALAGALLLRVGLALTVLAAALLIALAAVALWFDR